MKCTPTHDNNGMGRLFKTRLRRSDTQLWADSTDHSSVLCWLTFVKLNADTHRAAAV